LAEPAAPHRSKNSLRRIQARAVLRSSPPERSCAWRVGVRGSI
jgi:hypothetical protein